MLFQAVERKDSGSQSLLCKSGGNDAVKSELNTWVAFAPDVEKGMNKAACVACTSNKHIFTSARIVINARIDLLSKEVS